jgi:glycerate kinase
MHILVAPDKLKGCLGAREAAAALGAGVLRADGAISVDLCPLADGGEGTVDALVAATGGRFEICRVTGPLPEMKVEARFGVLGDGKTAVIEMAAASGLALLKPEDRDPKRTTTFGTGELLMAAARLGVSEIILGIGGSATLDGGVGCAQACGLPVILEEGETVSPGEPLTGADVQRVELIKHGRGSAIERVKITLACDVTNPLCGPDGAAAVFGPQKGATPEDISMLDAALLQLARRHDKLNVSAQSGAGAAGGLGFGMAAFFGATLRPGFEIVAEAVRLQERLLRADLCLTGEGRIDAGSFRGKVTGSLGRLCQKRRIPCVAIAGSVDREAVERAGQFTAAMGLCDEAMPMADSMARAEKLLEGMAERVTRIFLAGRGEESPG